MADLVFRRDKFRAILEAMAAGTGILVDSILRVYQNDLTPNANSVLADFEIADFSGYADVVIAAADWNQAFIDADGNAVMMGPNSAFNHSGGGISNTIYGYYLVQDGVGGEVIFSERFDVPKQMTTVADSINLTLRLSLKANEELGANIAA